MRELFEEFEYTRSVKFRYIAIKKVGKLPSLNHLARRKGIKNGKLVLLKVEIEEVKGDPVSWLLRRVERG